MALRFLTVALATVALTACGSRPSGPDDGGGGGAGGGAAGGSGGGGFASDGGDGGVSDGGAGADAGDDAGVDGGGTDGGVDGGVDREWAQWRMPFIVPVLSNYTTTTDTVLDALTGLLWQRIPPTTTYTWADARTYCDSLTLGGTSDWRLPTRIELVSIAAYKSPPPAIQTGPFPGTPQAPFWTASPRGASAAWFVVFTTGASNFALTTQAMNVRCVTAGLIAPGPHYTVNADTVVDNATGLTWQRATPPPTTNPLGYCQALNLAGLTGWRQPSVKEMLTLVDIRASSPAIDTAAFPGAVSGTYLVQPSPSNLDLRWVVRLGDGDADDSHYPVNPDLVRCVR